MEQVKRTGAVAPTPALQAAVKDCLDRDGERITVERLGISRISVAKLAAGSPVRRGTLALAAGVLGIALLGGARG
jgi:hypothetical protein